MERISKFRSVILLFIFVGILMMFCVKLYTLQIIETKGSTDNTTTYTTMTRVKAARGDILDRNGNILVGNRASYDLVFNHYVIISSKGTNESLQKLIDKCNELGITYNDHFPVTKTTPFEYTLDDYSATWRNHFQTFLGPDWCDMDSDITAPLLMQKLREIYEIPETFTDEEARAVVGLRYELDLRNVTNLATFVFVEDISDENLSILLELNIPGLMVEASTVREYYTTYAAHILGSVGAMDAADWAKYEELGYAMDAYIGQSGFEEAFELYLHAEDGTRIDVVDKTGTMIAQYYANKYDENGNLIGKQEPVAGNNVETTIDIELQAVAEDALGEIMRYLVDPIENVNGEGLDAEGAAVVVIECKTGDVLVCASYPTFDLSTLNESYKEIEEADFAPLYNRALQGAYPPGSAFKPVTLIAAMNNGAVTFDEKVQDLGIFTKYENFSPTCLAWSSYRVFHGGTEGINCVTALEVSCNYYFYEMVDRLYWKYNSVTAAINRLDAVSKAMGLGEPTGVELPENIGHRSNPETKKAQYTGMQAQFFVGDLILTAIGQSDNRFTPMQLAVYASTLANRGTRMKATFLNRVVSSDYSSLIMENEPVVANTFEITEEAYRGYMEGMYSVIKGVQGTARDSFGGGKDSYNDRNGMWSLDGVKIYAKTGTAETFKIFSDNGSFICFAARDGEEPEIAIALYGEKAAHGSTLAYVAEEIVRAYFDVGEGTDITAYENKLG